MSTVQNRVTIYRLPPEEVELFLATKYGGKIATVNAGRLARLNQKREKYAADCLKSEVETPIETP